MQTFILDDEPTTRMLVQAARRGVQVRLLVDSMITAELPLKAACLCRAHPNLELRLYSPESGNLADSALARIGALLVDFDGFNQRMHNKLVVVDEEVAICGGRNCQDSYFDVAVAGPVVERMAASYDQYSGHMLSVAAEELRDVAAALEVSESDWPFVLVDLGVAALAAGVECRLRGGGDPLRYYDVAEVALWVDAPGKPSIDEGAPSVARSLIGAIGGAQRSIWAQSPYLVLSDAALELLRLVRARGVTVQLHTNSLASTDNWPSYAHAMRQRRDVLEGLDLEVFELNPYPEYMLDVVPGHDALASSVHPNGPLLSLHAKSLVIDDQLAVVGSYNLAPRSEALNTEVLLAVWDREFAQALAASIARDAAPGKSWVVAVRERSLPRALVAEVGAGVNDVLRGVTTLDLWPFAWSAQFELAPGQAPVSRRHPDFYRRYIDVGSFPEVGRVATVVMVELARSLTGFVRPFM